MKQAERKLYKATYASSITEPDEGRLVREDGYVGSLDSKKYEAIRKILREATARITRATKKV